MLGITKCSAQVQTSHSHNQTQAEPPKLLFHKSHNFGRCLLLAAVAAVVSSAVAQTSRQPLTSISAFEKVVVISVDSAQSSIALPDSFLIPHSEAVRWDSVALHRPADYTMNYIDGIIFLKSSIHTSDSLRVAYKIFPFALRKSYAHRQPIHAKTDSAAPAGNSSGQRVSASPQPAPGSPDFLPTGLRKSGSIIRGVSVGSNQGLQVNSGLRLQIEGKLAQNIDVVASLTDQDTPIQPEGNTQTLNEIDKVFIQITGSNLQATLGDFNIDLTGTELMRYNRKLEGVLAQGNLGRSSVKVSAAVSRGQFTTNEFQGQEGNQGPYQLTGENGNVNILVLAGTEKVWVDGELMTRGENHDYVIEYGNGQITFTRNRLITSDSRIVVDFQFSDESFQRNYIAATGETHLLADKVTFKTTFIRESDDQNDPLTIPLSDNALSVLESAGDGEAVVPGDTLVGAGEGNYTKDSTGVFEYVGPGKGDHNVRFSFFGPGRGNYRNIGLGRFEFVGEGNGDYRPFILLPRAQQHQLVGFKMDAAPTSFLNLRSELAFSERDNNTYSPLDDGNNAGTAYTLNLNLAPQQLQLGSFDLGRVDFSGRIRQKTADFQDIDRTTEAEFDRRWNIDDSTTTNEERILELSGRYEPLQGLSVRAGLGRLSKSAQFSANRWEVHSRLQRGNWPGVDYFVEVIERDNARLRNSSSWLRQRGRAQASLWRFKPVFEYEGEVRKDTQSDTSRTGFRFDSYAAGLGFAPWKSLHLNARFNVRDDKDRTDGIFIDKSIARTQQYGLTLRNWHAFHVTATYTHRNRDFNEASVQDTRTDLADVQIGYRPGHSGVRGNLYYQLSNTQIARQEEVFVEVDEGSGNFRFNEELNEFEPDPFGNFVRRLFSTKDFVPVVELRMRADMRLTPAKFLSEENSSWLTSLLKPVSTETFVRIDERTREKDVRRVYLLDPGVLQQDSTTIFGSIELRQDVHLWENSRDFALRYRYRNRNELNNQFVGGGQDRETLQHLVRLRAALSRQISTQIEFGNRSENRSFQAPGRNDRQIRANELEVDMAYRPQPRWEVALRGSFSRSKDILPDPDTKATILALAPRATYSLSSKGRARAEIEWTRVDLAPRARLIPFELTEGNRAGTTFRWNFGFDYRVSRNVQASVNYFGRNEPDRPRVQHIARVEMRAFF